MNDQLEERTAKRRMIEAYWAKEAERFAWLSERGSIVGFAHRQTDG
jgi:hypothetical protein